MRGTKAKSLRRIARLATPGAEDRVYLAKKHDRVIQINIVDPGKSKRKTTFTIYLDPKCTRGVYLSLKRGTHGI